MTIAARPSEAFVEAPFIEATFVAVLSPAGRGPVVPLAIAIHRGSRRRAVSGAGRATASLVQARRRSAALRLPPAAILVLVVIPLIHDDVSLFLLEACFSEALTGFAALVAPRPEKLRIRSREPSPSG
jgi:hypothetical protein